MSGWYKDGKYIDTSETPWGESYGSSSTDIQAALEIARRATDVERERCLALIESLYVGMDPARYVPVDSHLQVARNTLVNVGMSIAGGDAGPHSDAALAWRRRVTGDTDDSV